MAKYITRIMLIFYIFTLTIAVYSMANAMACMNKEILMGDNLPSLHDRGFENAWIQFIENGLVQVQTIDTKIAIVFKPITNSELKKYHVGWIAPVTFECNGEVGSCDLSLPYKLYIGRTLVAPLEISHVSK